MFLCVESNYSTLKANFGIEHIAVSRWNRTISLAVPKGDIVKFDYDLFVIGAGSGGLAAAKRAASYGAHVAIAEEELVGGTCLLRGCIPKKLMVYASQFSHLYQDAVGYGWHSIKPHFNWQVLVAAIDREIRRLSAVHMSLLQKAGVDLIEDRAMLLDPHTIAVGTQQVTAEKILLAVGSKPVLPNLPGVEQVITSRQMFALPKQPQRIAIVGSGYIGTEFASIMNGLGSTVTQIIRRDLILNRFDDDIRAHLQASMSRGGVQFLTNTKVEGIEAASDGIRLTLSTLEPSMLIVDQVVLFAIGRTPNISGLGLETVDIAIDRGAIVVNAVSQTNLPHIFAVGDCTNRIMLTPAAIAEGRAFADAEFGHCLQPVNYDTIPTAVFSQPEVGTVGLTETAARQRLGDLNVVVYRAMFRPLFHSLTERDEKTLMKLVVDRQTDRILGVHMVGNHAAEIIQSVAIAVNMGATKRDFDATMALHPTTAEELVTMQ
jgi:glutathione reductase (NADPH)